MHYHILTASLALPIYLATPASAPRPIGFYGYAFQGSALCVGTAIPIGDQGGKHVWDRDENIKSVKMDVNAKVYANGGCFGIPIYAGVKECVGLNGQAIGCVKWA